MTYHDKLIQERLRVEIERVQAERLKGIKAARGQFEEQRGGVRAALDFGATYALPAGPFVDARLTELSKTGLRLRVEEPLPVGAEIAIAMGRDFPIPRLRLQARVARLIPGDGPPFSYGLQILADPATRRELATAVLAISVAANKRR